MLKYVFVFICCASFLYSEEVIIQAPPKGWECINDPTQLPQKIKLIYIGQGTTNKSFNPSLNVACEPTALPLDEYVKTVKGYHESQKDTRCALLGRIQTAAGPAQVLQLDRTVQWGHVRFVQAIMIRNGQAFVVTATCLKEDFSALSAQIVKAIQSFTIQ